jgi:hypothetical protein
LALVCLAGASASAKVLKGTDKANRVVGTKKADVIRLAGGNDRAWGRGGGDRIMGGRGRDRLNGGRGNDRLTGGKGADRLTGAAGRDRLNAVDRRKDARVDGGAGRNVCRVDAADLSVVRRCFTLKVAPGGGAPGGGGPGGGGQGGDAGLQLVSATGLSCASSLPTCSFELSGTGADAVAGTVSGGGGVQPGAGAAASVSDGQWTARGLYGCSDDGFLRVTIGSEHVDVPITCTA